MRLRFAVPVSLVASLLIFAPAQAAGPVAVDDSYTLPSKPVAVKLTPSLLANDTQPALFDQVDIDRAPAHGKVVPQNGLDRRDTTYQPDEGFVGTDTFTYHYYTSGGTGPFGAPIAVKTNIATVTINVTAAPIEAVDDSYTLPSKPVAVKLTPSLLANDTQPALFDQVDIDRAPAHGKVVPQNGLDRRDTTYQPDEGFVGTDTFTYHYTSVGTGRFGAPIVVKTNIAT